VRCLRTGWIGLALVTALLLSLGIQTQAAPGSVEDARKTLKTLHAQLVILDQDLNEFGAQVFIIMGQLLNARQLISAGKGHINSLVRGSIEFAITVKELALSINLVALDEAAQNMVLTLSSLIGKINALCPPLGNKLNADKCTLVLSKLNSINLYLEALIEEIDLLVNLLEDGDDGEDETNPDDFDDVDDWLEFCLLEQLPNDQQVECSQSLGRAHVLLMEIIQEMARIHSKKKYLAKKIANVQKLLLTTGAPKIIKVSREASTQAQIFNLAGRWLYEGPAFSRGTLEWATLPLADGVYLYVTVTREESGAIRSRAVQKFVVRR
jgi:hypothetical protein